MMWVSAIASLTAALSLSGSNSSDFDIFSLSATEDITASDCRNNRGIAVSQLSETQPLDRLKRSRLTFMYRLLQLKPLPASPFFCSIFSSFKVALFEESLVSVFGFLSTAGRTWSILPWKDDLSISLYACRADGGEAKRT